VGYDIQIVRKAGGNGGDPGAEEGSTYFRLNIGGMATMRILLNMLDVLEDEGERIRSPDQRARDPNKVLAVKFRSNDDWLIVPDEARIIGEAIRRPTATALWLSL
jgi:hypothetical protein